MTKTSPNEREVAVLGALLSISSKAGQHFPAWAREEWLENEKRIVMVRAYQDGVTIDEIQFWISTEPSRLTAEERCAHLLEFVKENPFTRLYIPRAVVADHTDEEVWETWLALNRVGTELILCHA